MGTFTMKIFMFLMALAIVMADKKMMKVAHHHEKTVKGTHSESCNGAACFQKKVSLLSAKKTEKGTHSESCTGASCTPKKVSLLSTKKTEKGAHSKRCRGASCTPKKVSLVSDRKR